MTDGRQSILKILQQAGATSNKGVKGSALLESLRSAASDWNNTFDDKKLILMVGGFNKPTSEFKGDKYDVLGLLQEAVEEGIPLEWKFGTVKYRVYGYGMGPAWRGYEWDDGSETPKISLDLHHDAQDFNDCDDVDCDDDDEMNECDDYDCGCVTMHASTEMIPSDYYSSKEYEEEFEARIMESSGNAGLKMKGL
jgi:hypothetical protein